MKNLDYYIDEFKKNTFYPLSSNDKDLPNKRGLYLISIKNFSEVPEKLKEVEYAYFENKPVLYVGISGKNGLRKRDYRNHFNGTARTSTLRKSIGVLNGYCKEQKENEIGTLKYKFTSPDEEKITEWMKTNLIMYYFTSEYEIEEIETGLIAYFNPPLNIMKNKNEINKDFRKYLSKMRCEI